MKRIYIFGAHSRGQTFKEYVTSLCPNIKIEAYLVDNLNDNWVVDDGTKILALDERCVLDKACPVYIATKSIYHKKIEEKLRNLGIKTIIPVDVIMDTELRNAYVRKVYRENNEKFWLIDEVSFNDNISDIEEISSQIYVSASVHDATLESEYILSEDEKVIQVGTALSEYYLDNAVFYDNIGDNISNWNRQFCELTAFYWIWKNAKEDIVGLVHYRRHFLLPNQWKKRMQDNEIDVILPVPLYVAPNLEENYKKRHDGKEWDYMMHYLAENYPDDYVVAKEFFKSNLYSPCNMFIMRKEVLDEVCQWLFPILDAVVEYSGQKQDSYQNRYPGFLSERLLTFFFHKQKGKYRVVYANKNFLR